MNIKNWLKSFFIKFYSGVSLGLIASGLTILAQNNFRNQTGWILASFGSVAFGLSEGFNFPLPKKKIDKKQNENLEKAKFQHQAYQTWAIGFLGIVITMLIGYNTLIRFIPRGLVLFVLIISTIAFAMFTFLEILQYRKTLKLFK